MKVAGKVEESVVKEHDEWLRNFRYEEFGEEIKQLGIELKRQQGAEDLQHLYKMVRWSNTFTALGIVLAPFLPVWCMIPSVLLAVGVTSRWTMIAHHTCHGGFEKLGDPGYSRFTFGVGSLWRRFLDWFDWFLPEAWNVEHNQLHHYKLGEDTDPDLVERNMAYLRDLPMAYTMLKYLATGFIVCTWKWWYYAPNTFKFLRIAEMKKNQNIQVLRSEEARLGQLFKAPLVLTNFLFGKADDRPTFVSLVDFLMRVMLPFVAYRFFLLPYCMYTVSATLCSYVGIVGTTTTYWTIVGHFVVADIVANLHSFIIIGKTTLGRECGSSTSTCIVLTILCCVFCCLFQVRIIVAMICIVFQHRVVLRPQRFI